MSKYSGAIQTGMLTLVIAIALSSTFELTNLAFLPATVILVVIIGVGIIFDIVGTSVTAANEHSLHAMAADRVPGARWAVYFVRRADRVANFCNDVIGDICGTTSGAAAAAIVVFIAASVRHISDDLLGILMVSLVAAITVSGKALGKRMALTEPEQVLVLVGRIIQWVDQMLGLKLYDRVNAAERRNRKRPPGARTKNSSAPKLKAGEEIRETDTARHKRPGRHKEPKH